jgi:hypothetical protein
MGTPDLTRQVGRCETAPPKHGACLLGDTPGQPECRRSGNATRLFAGKAENSTPPPDFGKAAGLMQAPQAALPRCTLKGNSNWLQRIIAKRVRVGATKTQGVSDAARRTAVDPARGDDFNLGSEANPGVLADELRDERLVFA